MSTQTLIANEVLAFIKHAIDYMDEVSILQICKTSFKEDEICSAKLLLFTTLGKLSQMPSRRRDGTEKSIQDIITLLKEIDPDDVPQFVAKDLHKLPPVTFDHVDVTRLLKDITFLKQKQVEMQHQLEVSNNTIRDLRAEVVSLRNAITASRSPSNANVNTRRGAQDASICSFESAGSNTSPAAEDARVATRAAAVPASTPVETTTCVGSTTPNRAYAAIVTAANKPVEPQNSQVKVADKVKGVKRSLPKPKQVLKGQCPDKDTGDSDGFIKVEKRKKRKKPPCRNQCGTALAGPNMLLRPAVPTTLLYVSRLHHSTKVEEVVEYMRVKTNWTLRVELLEPRHKTNFKSFVVRVPTHHLEKFLKDEFWPKGVMYRRFRGQLRDTSQRNTTPTLCVH